MARRVFRRLVPLAQDFLREHSVRRLFGKLLHHPNLWHLNRTSVSTAVSLGLFVAFFPVPGQMLIAAAGAIVLACNLPLAVLFVWVSNPITLLPMFYAAYRLGAWLLDEPYQAVEFEPTIDWLLGSFGEIWQPLLLGCFVLGVASAAIGNVAVRLVWRIHVVASWRERRRRRRESAAVTRRERPLTRERDEGAG